MGLTKVRFKKLNYAEYISLEEKVPSVIYFIRDKPFIYVDNVQYGLTLDESKHLVTDLKFDSETNELLIGISGSTTVERVPINIKTASALNDGLMSKEHVSELSKNTEDVAELKTSVTWIDVK